MPRCGDQGIHFSEIIDSSEFMSGIKMKIFENSFKGMMPEPRPRKDKDNRRNKKHTEEIGSPFLSVEEMSPED